MMASDKSFYPEGTDMSYFEDNDKEVMLVCPQCGELGVQIVFAEADRRSLDGECEWCEYKWREEWYEIPDIDYCEDF